MSGDVDPAVSRARAVVGLYGDPTVSWSIALDVVLAEPIASDLAADLHLRCAALTVDNPRLGTAPTPVRFDDETAADVLLGFLDTPYGDHDPLVRVGHSEHQGRLLVAAHHGAVDGLGLLAVLSLLLGEDVVSTARGIGDRTSTVGFLRSSVARVVEALVTPPTRLAADPPQAPGEHRGRQPHGTAARTPGDVTAAVDLPPMRVDTAGSVAAAVRAVGGWNRSHGSRADRLVVAIGASRRDGSAARPDRDTAYLRLRLPPDAEADAATVGRLLRETSPEPTFPERRPGGWTSRLTRLLRDRLGSSLLVSNLGYVEAPAFVRRIAFYPSAAGPRALAVGVASTSTATTLTVRMPTADFTTAAAAAISTTIAAELAAAQRDS